MQQNSRPASCGLRRRFGVVPFVDESITDFAIATLPIGGFAHKLFSSLVTKSIDSDQSGFAERGAAIDLYQHVPASPIYPDSAKPQALRFLSREGELRCLR
jgi:hypothetical protein